MHSKLIRIIRKYAKSLWHSRFKKTRLPHVKPRTVIILVAVALLLGVVGGKYINKPSPQPEKTTQQSSRNQTGELTKETPTFKTLLPEGKTIDDLGGWTRVSPKNTAAAYGYADMIAKTPIIVSQQELPEEMKDDVEGQVNTLAEGYHASKIVKAGPTTLHIGTSAKGPQSVIFAKKSLLILIKSSAKISDEEWSMYVNNLQ